MVWKLSYLCEYKNCSETISQLKNKKQKGTNGILVMILIFEVANMIIDLHQNNIWQEFLLFW